MPQLRLTAYLMCLWLLATLALSGHVRAHTDERMLDAGRQLAQLATLTPDSDPQTLRVNGVELQLGVGVSDLPLASLLDAFHARCLRPDGELWRRPVPPRQPARPAAVHGHEDSVGDGVLRGRIGSEGYVACLHDPRAGQAPRWHDWGRRFLADGRLRTPGALRYVMARQLEGRVRYVTLGSGGAIDLSAALPVTGDAPAAPWPWPRPRSARLWLDAETPPEPSGIATRVAVFMRPAGSPPALGRYARSLERAGFAAAVAVSGSGLETGFHTTRGPVRLQVAAATDAGVTEVVVVASPSGARPGGLPAVPVQPGAIR